MPDKMPELKDWPNREAAQIRIERREGCNCETCVELSKAKLVVIGVVVGWLAFLFSGCVTFWWILR